MLLNRDFTFRVSVDVASKGHSQQHRLNSQHRDNHPVLAVHQISQKSMNLSHPGPTLISSKEKRLRVCFVKYISWQPELPEVFAVTYKSLRFINTLNDVDSKLKYIQTLPQSLQNHPAIIYDYGIIEHIGANEQRSNISTCGTEQYVRSISSGEIQHNIDRSGQIEDNSGQMEHNINRSGQMEHNINRSGHMEHNINKSGHMKHSRDSMSNRRITGIHVPNEWLEKQQIAWWSLPRLQLILKNSGKHGGHIFRCGFLSTLGVITQHFLHASRAKKQHDEEMRRRKNPFIYELDDLSTLMDVMRQSLEIDAMVQSCKLHEFEILF